ncbi:MAG: ABC transporter permease, partial [Actinomycetota bacterium]
IDDLPRFLQWLSYLVPLRYAAEILQGVLVRGDSFFSMWQPFLALAGVGVALVACASLTLRERT